MKISIIIPTYNRASLLPRAILSIPKNINAEIVVVDDCSTDNTVDIVKSLSLNDERIILIQLKTNGGVNIARNAGIRESKGDWVCFLDSDDEYIEGGVEVLFKKLSSLSDTISVVGFMTMREVNGVMEPRGYAVQGIWDEYEPSYEEIILKKDIQGDIHYCVRRDVFVKGLFFDENINGFEVAFFSLMAKAGFKFLYINKIVNKCYSHSSAQLSKEPFKRWPRQFASAYNKFIKDHYDVLKKDPSRLISFYKRTYKCYLYTSNPRGIEFLIKIFLLKLNFFLRYSPSILLKKIIEKIVRIVKLKLFNSEKRVRISFFNNDFSIFVKPQNGFVDRTIYLSKNWDEDVGEILRKYLNVNSVFVDIGANIGFFSLLASRIVGEKGKVISFEPLVRCRTQMEKSIAYNNMHNILIFPLACGSSEGFAEIYLPTGNLGGSSLSGRVNRDGKPTIGEIENVQIVLLDSILKNEKQIDLIKIDVEGYELDVLLGAKSILQYQRPLVVIEFSPLFYEQIKPGNSKLLIEYMDEQNYVFLDIHSNQIQDIYGLTQQLLRTRGQMNIICLPKEKLD